LRFEIESYGFSFANARSNDHSSARGDLIEVKLGAVLPGSIAANAEHSAAGRADRQKATRTGGLMVRFKRGPRLAVFLTTFKFLQT
jgi:hypothetical protein